MIWIIKNLDLEPFKFYDLSTSLTSNLLLTAQQLPALCKRFDETRRIWIDVLLIIKWVYLESNNLQSQEENNSGNLYDEFIRDLVENTNLI